MDEIRHLRRASMNLMFSDNFVSRSISKCMDKFLGLKTYEHPLPIGYRDCEAWIRQAQKDFGLDSDKVEGVLARIEDSRRAFEQKYKDAFKGTRVLLYISINTRTTWLFELLKTYGVEIVGILCPIVNKFQTEVAADELMGAEGLKIEYDVDMAKAKDRIEEIKPDIVMGDVARVADFDISFISFDAPRPGIGFMEEYARRLRACIQVSRYGKDLS